MRVAEMMSRDVCIASPDDSIREAARLMADRDIGFLPVGENDRLVGMITDRDIAVRAVAVGKSCDCAVGEVMTRDVKYCQEDDDLDEVIENMGELQVRRFPVIDRNKRLTGIIALTDAVRSEDEALPVAHALRAVAQPGGQHSQAMH